jgi:hypothetical protein
MITLHSQITAKEYVNRLGNQVHHMIQTLFPKNYAVLQDDNGLIHTAGIVQSWFEEHEGELQHLPWPAKPPDLNTPSSADVRNYGPILPFLHTSSWRGVSLLLYWFI